MAPVLFPLAVLTLSVVAEFYASRNTMISTNQSTVTQWISTNVSAPIWIEVASQA